MTIGAIPVKGVETFHDHVLVRDMKFDQRQLSSGIFLLGDDARTAGIRPRWARVFAVGPEQKDVKVDEWVLMNHGRWTRGVKIELDSEEITIRRIDPKDILLISDEQPATDDNISTAVQAYQKER